MGGTQSIASRLRDSSGLHVSGQREQERQRSGEEGIVSRHSNLHGCQIWETFTENGLCINIGSLEKVGFTDHGGIVES